MWGKQLQYRFKQKRPNNCKIYGFRTVNAGGNLTDIKDKISTNEWSEV